MMSARLELNDTYYELYNLTLGQKPVGGYVNWEFLSPFFLNHHLPQN